MPLVFVLAMVFIASTAISAHRLDEYLQAARIALDTDAVEIDLDLTPGVAIAESIISLIDVNADGSLSVDEQSVYAHQVIDDLKVTLDGEPLALRLSSMKFPDSSAFRRGEGMIQLRARAAHRVLPGGSHQLHIRNTHERSCGAYLANALVPSNPVVSVTAQHRDGDQQELTIDYSVGNEAASYPLVFLVVCIAGFAALAKTVNCVNWGRVQFFLDRKKLHPTPSR